MRWRDVKVGQILRLNARDVHLVLTVCELENSNFDDYISIYCFDLIRSQFESWIHPKEGFLGVEDSTLL